LHECPQARRIAVPGEPNAIADSIRVDQVLERLTLRTTTGNDQSSLQTTRKGRGECRDEPIKLLDTSQASHSENQWLI
jgi:hypothetical protein